MRVLYPLGICVLLVLSAFPAAAKFPAALHVDQRYPDDVSLSDQGHWDLLSGLPLGISTAKLSDYERRNGSGMHADNAWRFYTSGDARVIIAVFDSGIQWDERDIVNKHYLNAGELPPPRVAPIPIWPGVDSAGDVTDCTDSSTWFQSGAEYDVNHDGVFNIRDYRCDSRVHPADGVARADDILDPSDLIHALHQDFVAMRSIDNDANGYVDDISGWDFMWDDNDPYDDTRYHHGTGEAKGSAAEADNGSGKPGVCPDCMLLNVRVSDSFVADSQNLAQGIVFAVDSGASVIQSALGPLTGSIHAQAAIDYAYERNVVAIMSAADETSMHHFPISAGENTLMVHAVVPDVGPGEWTSNPPSTFLNFSNCTNYGAHLYISTPSTSCSSGAVKMTAGAAGLMYAYALQNGLMPLTANEAQQLFRAGADDIDYPEAADDPKRFPSQEGWDQYFGYGRTNIESSLRLMAERKIPPEAGLTHPRWFEVIDPARTPRVPIRGLAAAPRSSGYKWELAYAYGITPAVGAFTNIIATGEATGKLTELGEWDLSKVDFAADRDYGEITSVNAREKVDQFTFTLRLKVTDREGNVGEYRKVVYLRKDPGMLPGFPIDLGSSGEASPKLADLDGDGRWDIIVGLADGTVHAYNHRGELLPGWPAETRRRDAFESSNIHKVVKGSTAYTSGAMVEMRSGIVATPAVGKLDGKHIAVVVATLDGDVYAFDKDARVLTGFPQAIDPVSGADTNGVQMLDDGYFASPVLADLDGDGTLEIITAAMDGQVYVYDHQGNRVAPFPLEARDRSMTEPEDNVDDPDHEDCVGVLAQLEAGRLAGGGYRSRIIGSPAVGDIDGDGGLEILVGTSEIYPSFCDSGSAGPLGTSRLYAFRPDGSQPAGYPMLVPNQTSILPYVGRGLPNAPVLVDINGDGADDITIHQIAQLGGLNVMDWTGKPLVSFDQGSEGEFGNVGSGGAFRGKPFPVLINFGTFGDLTGDGVPDYFVGGVSSDMLVGMSNDGVRRDADHMLLGWNGATGDPLPGFPRVMEDIQFFMNPSVADLDGDGRPEVLNGSGGFILHAWNHMGKRPEGWPKFTGQWIIASPAVGDIDGDGFLEVVVNTRNGFLFAWTTQGPTQRKGRNAVQWASFRHDNHNTGNYGTRLPMQPGPDGYGGGCSCGASGSGMDWPGALLFFGTLFIARWVLRRPKPRLQDVTTARYHDNNDTHSNFG